MVGEFKDDVVKNHQHPYSDGTLSYDGSSKLVMGGSSLAIINVSPVTGEPYGGGTVNRGKRKGVKYIIKVL